MPKQPQLIYQVKVTLRWTRPPIWRRFQVLDDTTLEGLHLVLQKVMGWGNEHLYEFVIAGRHFSDPELDMDGVADATRTKLAKVVTTPAARFTYLYDFGDGWEHQVVVEKVLPRDSGSEYPVCIAGKRACPLEDCGGIGGYLDMLNALITPKHPRRAMLREWLGGKLEWDAERFSLEEVNGGLRRLHQ